ncbi:hypothetical protein KR018_009921, partial [Drosophila ironensis]
EAAHLLAGIMPFDLQARELYNRSRRDPGSETHQQREMAQWQQRWDSSEKGAWTRALIPCVETWVNRKHGQLNFHLTQFLSGHGFFRDYLYRFGHVEDPFCPACGKGCIENPEHVIFSCPRFVVQRDEAERSLEVQLKPANLVSCMLTSTGNWEAIDRMANSVMKELRRAERSRHPGSS